MKHPWHAVGQWTLGLLLLWATAQSYNVLLASLRIPFSTPVDLGGMLDFAPATSAALERTEGVPLVRLAFVGDIMQHLEQAGDDFSATYQAMAPLLHRYDLVVGNLEFPVDPGKPIGPSPGSVRFNGSLEHLRALARAGVRMVSTANNHSFDQGYDGLVATLEALRAEGIESFGTAAAQEDLGPKILRIGPLKLAFVAYTFSPNVYHDGYGHPQPWPKDWPVNELYFEDWSGAYRAEGISSFARHVAAARAANADFTIACVHWGREWRYAPGRHQRLAARDMIAAGIDLVIGSHAHVLNPAELVDGKLVAYSLGNFVSAFRQLELRTAAVLEVTLVRGADAGVSVGDFVFRPILTQGEHHAVKPIMRDAKGEAGRAWRFAQRILGEAALKPYSPEDSVLRARRATSGSPAGRTVTGRYAKGLVRGGVNQ